MGLVAVRLQRAYLDILVGRATGADERVAAARALHVSSSDARFCLRLIDRALRSRGAEGLRVGPEARWFEARWLEAPGRVDLAGQHVLRLLLLRLAEAHAEAPGEPLSTADLFAHGWPGERAIPSAMANRVRVALHRLRKLGVGASLVRRPDGWLLDPALQVVRDGR
jgi:hypothetical protein